MKKLKDILSDIPVPEKNAKFQERLEYFKKIMNKFKTEIREENHQISKKVGYKKSDTWKYSGFFLLMMSMIFVGSWISNNFYSNFYDVKTWDDVPMHIEMAKSFISYQIPIAISLFAILIMLFVFQGNKYVVESRILTLSLIFVGPLLFISTSFGLIAIGGNISYYDFSKFCYYSAVLGITSSLLSIASITYYAICHFYNLKLEEKRLIIEEKIDFNDERYEGSY